MERRMRPYFARVNRSSYKLFGDRFFQKASHFQIDGPETHTSHIWVDPQLLSYSTAALWGSWINQAQQIRS